MFKVCYSLRKVYYNKSLQKIITQFKNKLKKIKIHKKWSNIKWGTKFMKIRMLIKDILFKLKTISSIKAILKY